MNKQKYTVEEFIRIANEVHNGKYDYSHIEYRGLKHKIKVICHEKDINGVEHGMYYITPHNHLKKDGCPKCSTRKPLNTEEFIKRANDIHGDKYDYSKVEYVNNKTKVCIICPEHGEFWQKPLSHLQGCNCFKCSRNIIGFNKRLTQEQFINRVKEIHRNKYNYSKVNYINSQTKVCIICPIHGEFWQTPHHHLSGQGCRICNQSHLEREVMMFLQEYNIKFEEQKTFDWLVYKDKMKLDFYLPDYNIAIECQGEQHFNPVNFGGEEKFMLINKRDKLKYQQCEENGVKLYYYSNLGIEYPYKVYENKGELLYHILEK